MILIVLFNVKIINKAEQKFIKGFFHINLVLGYITKSTWYTSPEKRDWLLLLRNYKSTIKYKKTNILYIDNQIITNDTHNLKSKSL